MIFDVNQTEFVSEKQKEVWQAGTHIVPLEVSLADVRDEETREGCRQIYDCSMEILTELYENADSYVYTSRWYTGDYLAWLTGSATPLKKHQEEYLRFLAKLLVFNTAIAVMYFGLIFLLGLEAVADSFAQEAPWVLILTWLLGNVVFFTTDLVLLRAAALLRHRLKKRR